MHSDQSAETGIEQESPGIPIRSDRLVSTHNVCGGDLRVAGTRIPVWGIAKAIRDGCSANVICNMYPTLSLDDVEAARLYAQSHTAEIDRLIAENEEA